MKVIVAVIFCATIFQDIKGQPDTSIFCDLPYPSDWPQDCVDAYIDHAENNTYTDEDRRALITFLNVVCPGDCLNSFLDHNTECDGRLTKSQAEFWRETYCLRDDQDKKQYCRVIMFDYIANTTMDDDYAAGCFDSLSRGDSCTSNCQSLVQGTGDYLGCCAPVFGNQSVDIDLNHYDACDVKIASVCGTPTDSGAPVDYRAVSGLFTTLFIIIDLILITALD